ncbi:crossover junction endodeoxyribonuclease RuvC [Ornithinimicrobium humiphilum]|uniref:Crossover junction endodeoxyribonuclease RuvC n=1 Tax=Ornithinimicrobium humiphilum TaxID=125288 RepID=A0A543KNT4_9MICO|nr:crossover junction endodeoxyribonuclease RuvC [Ornithinimicrobium humiphilum]TQM96728.1 Holliday junction endonuclease RuvC [Ornithinimicrobium humiphilum]
MRVLGVDPGLTRCGLGVVEGLPGRRLRMVAVGVVRTPATDDPQDRLLSVQTEIDQWLADWRPDAIAVERVFAKANIKGIMGTAQASAIPMLAAARLGLALGLHTPSEVKAAVTGNGRADKAQVTHMVTRILALDVAPRPADAADALALAICHLWRSGADERLAAEGSAPNLLQQAERLAGQAPPNRLAQLHASHQTAARSAAARAAARAATTPGGTTR